MWRSHTPAGTGRPAESRILGSAFPEHSGSPPAEPLGYRSDIGSGPPGLCSGPPSPSGCIPGSPSTMEEESRIYHDDSFKPRSLVSCIIFNRSVLGTGTDGSPSPLITTSPSESQTQSIHCAKACFPLACIFCLPLSAYLSSSLLIT